jgi:NAD(P)-dependent dehydrogenase (short-subunit alcohol dehydrogenase family)
VYLASRSEDNIAAAIERLESDGIGDGEVRSLKLDLSDPRTAKAAAEEFLDMEDRLDILSM